MPIVEDGGSYSRDVAGRGRCGFVLFHFSVISAMQYIREAWNLDIENGDTYKKTTYYIFCSFFVTYLSKIKTKQRAYTREKDLILHAISQFFNISARRMHWVVMYTLEVFLTVGPTFCFVVNVYYRLQQWGTSDAEITPPPGGSTGLSKIPF